MADTLPGLHAPIPTQQDGMRCLGRGLAPVWPLKAPPVDPYFEPAITCRRQATPSCCCSRSVPPREELWCRPIGRRLAAPPLAVLDAQTVCRLLQ